ncbi:MAG: ATP-binding cassette domain-containing protein [Myxococcaceae bacterium]|jgi:ATPase subunit of ABC transporter with duplicated ATPase domains|nr:ATP-binding cassette domain-containing protein [Myxococcaceae bacterium]
MSALTLHHLGGEAAGRVLFTDVTLTLARGWTGLVGPNGAGKSTLLAMLAGQRVPDAGHVQHVGGPLVVAFVPQSSEAPGRDVIDFALANDAEARRWRARLALDEATFARWPTASSGERQRWLLAGALWRRPDVLLLDEPTNHLDADARALVTNALRHRDVVGLVVSHDRAFLDELTTRTWRLVRGRVEAYDGPYSLAREAWRRTEASQRHAHASLGRTVERLDQSLDERARQHGASTRSRSAGARMRSKADSDARGVGANFRAERAQRHLAHAQRRVEQRLSAVEAARGALPVVFDETRPLVLEGPPCPQPVVARLHAGPVCAPDGRRLVDVTAPLEVRRDARLAFVGPNGAGKTTLLERVLAGVTAPPERCLVLPQTLTPETRADDLSWLRSLERHRRGRVAQWLDALGLDADAVLRGGEHLSVGEARLLRLARGLEVRPWLLVLDEPTNHLSMELIERLEGALASLEVALLVVSHDARFLEVLDCEVWRLAGDGTPLSRSPTIGASRIG